MVHLSVYRRMIVWAIGIVIAMVGAARITFFGFSTVDILLFIGGWIIIIVNETIFWLRKTQLEIDSDEAIKRLEKKKKEEE